MFLLKQISQQYFTFYNRLLLKTASGKKSEEKLGHRTRTYIEARKNSSTEPTYKLPAEVGLKKHIDKGFINHWNQKSEWASKLIAKCSNSNPPQNTIPTKEEKKIILMIDDEETCLLSMELMLENSNYKLEKAQNGTQGLDYVKRHYNKISLILLDLMLPDIYVLDILKLFKSDSNFKEIPVIIQTASININDIKEAKTAGAIDCLKKPYTKDIALTSIKKFKH